MPGVEVSHGFNNVDLHNHSTASDGLLAPAALIALAARNGCDTIALTDHDTTVGLADAAAAAGEHGIRFIPGVEISVSWTAGIDARSTTLHIVGLNIDPGAAALRAGLDAIRDGRLTRGQRIADEFAKIGVHGLFDDAYALANNKDMLGRTHFARALVARGLVKDVGRAFTRYLTPGNPGYVAHQWASLVDAITWIRAAGGVAVIAHPGRYRLDATQRVALFDEFKSLGGEAIEVVTGSHKPREYLEFAAVARRYGFLASRGADFHAVGESDFEPGLIAALPTDLTPVWSLFRERQ